MTNLRTRRVIPAIAALGAAASVAPAAAGAATVPSIPVSGGSTVLTVDPGVINALGRVGVRLGGSGTSGRTHTFRVSRGRVFDPATDAGVVDHAGTLTFIRSGGRRLTLADPTLTTGRGGSLNMIVGGRRVSAFTVSGGAVTRPGFDTGIVSALVRIDAAGARGLNRALRINVFRTGMRIGALSSTERLRGLLVKSGSTSLALSPVAMQRLAQGGITATPVAPATVTPGTPGPKITLPAVPGTLLTFARNGADIGKLVHSGGVTFSQPSTGKSVTTSNYTVDTTQAAPKLTVSLSPTVTGTFADLALTSQPVINPKTRTITISGVATTLDPAAAQYLQATFPTAGFQAGDNLGTGTETIQAQ